MSFTDRPTMRINSTNDLLALLPFVLGFHPQASLVLAGLTESGIPLTSRVTLPAATDPSGPFDAALQQTVAGLTALPDVSVAVVGYGPADQVEPAVTTAARMLRDAGIPIRESLRVTDGRFWRLRGDPATAEPAQGVPFDPASSPVTAAAVYDGLVALPDREAFVATLDPVTGPARTGMADATVAACTLLADLMDAATPQAGTDPDAALDTPIGHALQQAARMYLTQILDSYQAGQPVDDEHAATLTALLELPSLWEVAARRTSAAAWQIAMWTDLVRRAEPEFATVPATLLALCALQAGNGALATIAVDRALATDPDDHFAQLLARSIDAGIDPDTVAALLAD